MSFANSSGVIVLLRLFLSSLVLTLSLFFCVFARNFDPTEYDAVPDTNPDYTKQLSNNDYDGTNTIGLLNQRVEIHYKMETINGVPVLTPYYTYSAKNFDLDNNTFNEMNSITPEGNINYDIDNSTFNGTDNGNWIDGSTLNGNSGEIVIDTSSFNTYNNISSKPFEYSSVADGSVGTQINSSTFNDHTDLTVENGGILEINDSTINLASDSAMANWFGLNNPDSVISRLYYSFFTDTPLYSFSAYSSGVLSFSGSPTPFLFPKLGGFTDFSLGTYLVPSGMGLVDKSGAQSYCISDYQLSRNYRLLRGNFPAFFLQFLTPIMLNITNNSVSSVDYSVISISVFDNVCSFKFLFLFSAPQWSISYVDERPVISSTTVYCTLSGFFGTWFNNLGVLFTQIFNLFANWYYPLDPDAPYWRYWNTDTQQQENINLAGVLYNITWYLGQMFLMNTWEAGSELETPIEDLNNAFTDLDNAEDTLWSPVEDAFNSFAPDSGDITALSALGWVGNYLQQIFVNLGSFNIVITLSLILGVCMQFIGYFKYKNG